MRKYVLENQEENARLEKQAQLKNYSLPQEMTHFKLNGNERVLDAGCGNALLGRYLTEQYPQIKYTGADISSARIADARSGSPKTFKFEVINLHQAEDYKNVRGKVDIIFNRYVMHHLRHHEVILKNFFDTLTSGGRVCLIDIDGLFVNLGTTNSSLRESIDKIAANFGGDLTVGRTLPALMKLVGFTEIKWVVEPMIFQGRDREDEIDQFKDRLTFAKPVMEEILGGELAFQRFYKDYISELSNPEVALFYNKFMIEGKKP